VDNLTVTVRHLRVAAVCCATLAGAVSVTGVMLAALVPGYMRAYVDGHLLVNATIGLAFALLGGCVVWARPRNVIGWLFLLQAWCGGALTAIGEPYGLLALRGHDLPLAAWLAWIGGWSWSVAFVLGPTVLLTLWPSGHACGRLRWLVATSAALVTLVTVMQALSPGAMSSDVARLGQPLVWRPVLDGAAIATALIAICLGACLIVAVRRLLRATSPEREQLGWYLVVSAAFFACSVWVPAADDAVIQPTLILILGWALLWYGLADLRLALRRTLVYGVLTGCVAAAYALVTGVLSARIRSGPVPALAAAALVSVGILPLREILQRGADRLVYGRRRDPAAAIAQVGARLRSPGDDLLSAVTVAVADALHSSYVAIEDIEGRVLAVQGGPCDHRLHAEPLDHLGVPLGRLVVLPRTPGDPLDRADLRVLHALTPHVAVAVRAAQLTAELERARAQVVAASLAERDRLRRDLHDGMGPSLSGLALGLEAAETLLATDAAATGRILARTRAEAGRAVTEIRRIVDGLRPDALDEAGLLGALRAYADLVSAGGDLAVDIAADDLDGGALRLDPDVEVAAYRIAQEAITNVVRHSGASRCVVRLTCHDSFDIEVTDNGSGIAAGRSDGVGLASIKQRAETGGGRVSVRTSAAGTRLQVSLPLEPR
jgi:signal transduction histidine kinase